MSMRVARPNALKRWLVPIAGFLCRQPEPVHSTPTSPGDTRKLQSLCRDQSRQYTKVLERLAELYLGSQGGILENPEDATLDTTSKLQSQQIAGLSQAVKQLETVASMHREDNSELTEQINDIDKRLRILEKFILER